MKDLKNLKLISRLVCACLLIQSPIFADELKIDSAQDLQKLGVADQVDFFDDHGEPLGDDATESGSENFQECVGFANYQWGKSQVSLKSMGDSRYLWTSSWKQLFDQQLESMNEVDKPNLGDASGTSINAVVFKNELNISSIPAPAAGKKDPKKAISKITIDQNILYKIKKGNYSYYLLNTLTDDDLADVTEISDLTDNFGVLKNEVDNYVGSVGNSMDDAIEAAKEHRKTLQNCTAYIPMTKDIGYVDYEDSEQTKPTKEKKSSFDGKITCQSSGAETQDYPACLDMIFAYNAATVGKTAMHAGQNIQMQDHLLDSQLDADPNDPAAALKVQEGSLEKQAEISYTRGAFNAAKAGTLFALLQKMPDAGDLQNYCEESERDLKQIFDQIDRDYNGFVAIFKAIALYQDSPFNGLMVADIPTEGEEENNDGDQGEGNDAPLWSSSASSSSAGLPTKVKFPKAVSARKPSDACDYVVNKYSHAMIQNGAAKDAVKKLMIDAGIESLTDVAKAEILKDHADKIGDAAKKVKSFEPVDISFQPGEELFSFCQANPNAEECIGLNGTQTRNFDSGSGITIGTLGSAQTDAGRLIGADSSAVDTATSSGGPTSRTNTTGRIGSAIDGVDKNSGFESAPPGAADVKQADANSGGGGGGGGGGGAAAPPGGGGNNAAAAGGRRPASGKVKGVAFSKGNGSLSFGRGGKRATRKKSKSKNPFSKLFGKKGGKRSGALNFRNPASIGKKKGSIFGMISNRYNEVTKSKRLLEYENKNKK